MSTTDLPSIYIRQEGAEELAREILERLRWPDGIIRCPQCGSTRPIYKQERKGVKGYYLCPAPHRVNNQPEQLGKPLVFTVRTHTILQRSHIPLDKWLYSLQILAQRSELSPLTVVELARRIDVTRDGASTISKRVRALRYGLTPHTGQNKFLLKLMARMEKEQVFPPV
jgi:hypothetical protein